MPLFRRSLPDACYYFVTLRSPGFKKCRIYAFLRLARSGIERSKNASFWLKIGILAVTIFTLVTDSFELFYLSQKGLFPLD